MSNKAVIIDAARSPIGVKNGEMVGMRPDDLAAQVVKGSRAHLRPFYLYHTVW